MQERLWEAINKNDILQVNLLVRQVDTSDDPNVPLNTALMYACRQGKIWMVQLLLDLGADPNYRSSNESTPLFCSLPFPYKDAPLYRNIIKLLVAQGANINCRGQKGTTPLIDVTQEWEEQPQTIKLLLDLGADVNAQDEMGCTPLIYATHHEQLLTVRMLLAAGADPYMVNHEGVDAMILFIGYNYIEIAEELLKYMPNIDRWNEDCTYIMYAAQEGCINIVRLLLGMGANITLTNREKKTALGIAKHNNHENLVELLETHINKGRV